MYHHFKEINIYNYYILISKMPNNGDSVYRYHAGNPSTFIFKFGTYWDQSDSFILNNWQSLCTEKLLLFVHLLLFQINITLNCLKKKKTVTNSHFEYLHFKIQIYPICTSCLYYILIKLKTIICVNISISMYGIVLSARWIILGTNLRNLSKDFRWVKNLRKLFE